MIDLFTDISEYCGLDIPDAHKLPIAIVGAGGIVCDAHLPAYQKAGLDVVGITDVDLPRAREVAERFGIPHVYESVEELLADDTVKVVDIAVPVSAQAAIFTAAVASGKHVLAQKPFAESPEIAAELVHAADKAGVVAAVNQQLRFDEGIAAAHRMIERGWIGDVASFSLTVNAQTNWEIWPWSKDMKRLEIMVHSIHYHDAVRWLMGEPTSVYAVPGRTPGQFPAGETKTTSVYRFGDVATALIAVNHGSRGGDGCAEFRIEGSAGAIRGKLGLMYSYPDGLPDTLEVFRESESKDGWIPYPVTQRWFPDAFIGTMKSLLNAIATGEPPRSSVADNVSTIRLVEALYESIESNSVVELS